MKRWLGIWLGLAWSVAVLPAHASNQLDISSRLQWDDNLGYCGECSIQQTALYYGAYISQYRAREIVYPTSQQQDVWVPETSGPIFDALRLNYEVWDSSRPTPQYPAYLVWTKGHLQQGHPVIIDVYVQGEDDANYDHIIPATGFTSVDTNTYHASDTLVFNDNYETTPYTRTFGSLYDTRAMTNNGATNEYCIPQDTDYGCAVTGIRDSSGTARPVSLKLNRRDEPNLARGVAPTQMIATVQVRALSVGSEYALLRYNDYHNVPTNNYLASVFNTAVVFVATSSVHTFTDTFMSDATVIYRCVPDLAGKPAITAVDRLDSGTRIRFTTLANRRYDVDWRQSLTSGSWSNVTTNVTGTGSAVTTTDSGALGQPRRFYRVRVKLP